jgi:hypothetical protein
MITALRYLLFQMCSDLFFLHIGSLNSEVRLKCTVNICFPQANDLDIHYCYRKRYFRIFLPCYFL